MTTGKKFTRLGLSAEDHAKRLQKEIELLGLEIRGHKEMIAKLRNLMDYTRMTQDQIKAVRLELSWRKLNNRRLHAAKRMKADSIAHWKARAGDAKRRWACAQEQRMAA